MATANVRNTMPTATTSLGSNSGVNPSQDSDRLLDARQVAAKLGVSERFIRDHTTRRFPRIRGVKLGKLLRYRAADVEIFMESLNTQASSHRS
jgi:predicted DNA-binding transcriptional regulator AlpA